MEEEETPSIPTRKELRKQKLMEYLAIKGRLKLPNPKPYLRDDDCQVTKPVSSTLKIVKGKENKFPVDTLRSEGTKVKTSAAQSTKYPPKRALGVSDKVNVKGNIQTGQQKAKYPFSIGDLPKSEPNQVPVLTHMNTAASSKSNRPTVTAPKKQPNTRMQSFNQASSKTSTVTKFRSDSKSALLGPTKSVGTRLSLGPVVKTKTGLIPAVVQPRSTQSHFLSVPARTAHVSTTSVKVRPGMSSTISVSQKSAMAHTKTFRNAALNNPVNERPVYLTARSGIKVQNQKTSNSKPLPGKHSQTSCQVPSRGLKSVPTSKCTVAPVKLERRVGMSTMNKSAAVPTDGVTKQKSECGGEKNGKPSKVPSRTPLEATTRLTTSKVVRRQVTQAAVADLSEKTKTHKETQSKKANVPLPLTHVKRSGAPVMSQTAPQPARTISLTGRAASSKTPKVSVRAAPQTEVKKLTADQEERMRKLQEWREARGISYKRPPMPVKPQTRRSVAEHQPFWTSMKEEDEAHSLICAVDRSLADCIKLLGEGCPPDQVKEVLSRLPAVSQKFAKYWICQVRLMELEGNLDVLPVFEEAVRVVLEPVDELRTVVFEILKKKDEIQEVEPDGKNQDQIVKAESSPEGINNPMMTPKPVRALISGEKGESSVVKYKITATPGGPPSQQREPARVNGQEVRFFTPVRRSVRIERASLRYPASLQEHDVCVASYNDLMSKEDEEKCKEQEDGETSPSTNDTPMYIYRQNEALKDKVLVRLFSD